MRYKKLMENDKKEINTKTKKEQKIQ